MFDNVNKENGLWFRDLTDKIKPKIGVNL